MIDGKMTGTSPMTTRGSPLSRRQSSKYTSKWLLRKKYFAIFNPTIENFRYEPPPETEPIQTVQTPKSLPNGKKREIKEIRLPLSDKHLADLAQKQKELARAISMKPSKLPSPSTTSTPVQRSSPRPIPQRKDNNELSFYSSPRSGSPRSGSPRSLKRFKLNLARAKTLLTPEGSPFSKKFSRLFKHSKSGLCYQSEN